MPKHYSIKEVILVILMHIAFIVLFIPFSVKLLIHGSFLSYLFYFSLPLFAFIIPILIIYLQERFHHKYGVLITICFVSDFILILTMLASSIDILKIRIDHQLPLLGNIIPYYLLVFSILNFLIHLEIFKRSFSKYHKIKIAFLNPPENKYKKKKK